MLQCRRGFVHLLNKNSTINVVCSRDVSMRLVLTIKYNEVNHCLLGVSTY